MMLACNGVHRRDDSSLETIHARSGALHKASQSSESLRLEDFPCVWSAARVWLAASLTRSIGRSVARARTGNRSFLENFSTRVAFCEIVYWFCVVSKLCFMSTVMAFEDGFLSIEFKKWNRKVIDLGRQQRMTILVMPNTKYFITKWRRCATAVFFDW